MIRSMKRHPPLTAFLVWLAVTLVTLFVGLEVAGAIGENTNSGLAGICGPYGPDAGMVGLIMLGSFPASIVAGVLPHVLPSVA